MHKDMEIDRLHKEIELLKFQRDSLRLELKEKSDEWSKIKRRLQQRQSIKRLLDSTSSLEDAKYNEESSSSSGTIIDLSEDVVAHQDSSKREYLDQCLHSEYRECTKTTDASLANLENQCPCCAPYYNAVNCSPSKRPQSSKHSFRQKMPNTPPGFWSVGFTQN